MATVTSASFNVTVQESSSPVTWEWDVPTLQDETNFYTNVMGWTIPSGADDFDNWRSTADYFFGNLHNDTESDDLWTWRHQLNRYGGSTLVGSGNTVQNWYDEVLLEFKNNLVAELQADDNPSQPTGFGYDHLYGQGLAVVYNDTLDVTIPPILDSVRGLIEGVPEYIALAAGGTLTVQETSGRGPARWAIVASYAAEATNDPDWITMRNNMARAYETSPDWEEGSPIVGGGGLFGAGRSQAINTGGVDEPAAYDAGRRFTVSFYIGLQAEAMWRLYIQTGSKILRERLIKMARYVRYYVHRPEWNFPSSGSRFGHEADGSWWHLSGGDGTASNCAADPSNEISLINTMIIGYKLTGEQDMLDFARYLFSRGNQYLPFPGQNYPLAAASTSHVYKYVDTISDGGGSINTKFQWNKGQLQYNYQIFENGGVPSIVDDQGPIQTLADSMASNTWAELTNADTATLSTLRTNTAGTTDRSLLEFSTQFVWNNSAKELHYRGGGASSQSDANQRHIRFSESNGTWDAVTDWHGGGVHQWNGFTANPRTGDLYFRKGTGTEIWKWTYERYPADVTAWDLFSTGGIPGGLESQAFEYHPDMNSGLGALLYLRGAGTNGQLYTSDETLTIWSQVSSNAVGSAIQNEQFSAYLPGQKWVMFGCGRASGGGDSTALGRIDENGTVDNSLGNAPRSFGTGSGRTGVVVGHPNGRVFGLYATGNELYEYDSDTDNWSTAGITQPPVDFIAHWGAGCIIPEYNVIYYCAQESGDANSTLKQWLYKL